MNGNVNLYDTYKANKDGKRYRVTEVGDETVKLVKLNEDGTRKHAGGRPRIMTVADLFRDFTKVNLPPVTVSKIEPQKPIQEEVEEKVGTPSENAAEKQKQTVREINHPEAHTLEDTFEEFRKKNEEDIEILKAELKDRVRENIDLKKTISKMQQQHEAEVADLKDRIMEKEAEANAVKKRKEEILKERTQYADALDNDSVAFEEILSLAETIQLVTTAAAKMAKQIIDKIEPEGRV
ncbi:MAG: hypothetical protein IJ594_08015 [Oscillospiraceae bacterium]|nr:hypothetical protein [Oscillospiraceae bacterium]